MWRENTHFGRISTNPIDILIFPAVRYMDLGLDPLNLFQPFENEPYEYEKSH